MRITPIIAGAALLCSINAARASAGEFSLSLMRTNQYRRPNAVGQWLSLTTDDFHIEDSRYRIAQPWGEERQNAALLSTTIKGGDATVRAAMRSSSDKSKGMLASTGLTQDMGGWILDAYATAGDCDLAVLRVGGTYLDLGDTDTYMIAGLVAKNVTRDTMRRPEELIRPLAQETLLGVETLTHTLPDEESPASVLAEIELGYQDDRLTTTLTLGGGTIDAYDYEDSFTETRFTFARDGTHNDTRLKTVLRRLDENSTTGAAASYDLSLLAEHVLAAQHFETGIGAYVVGSGSTISRSIEYYDALGAALKAGITTRAGTFGLLAAYEKSVPDAVTTLRAAAYHNFGERKIVLGVREDEKSTRVTNKHRSVFVAYEGGVGPFFVSATAGIGSTSSTRYGNILVRYTTSPKEEVQGIRQDTAEEEEER